MRPARLACIRRAASVHPEPGSNSLNGNLTSFHYSTVKEHHNKLPRLGDSGTASITTGYQDVKSDRKGRGYLRVGKTALLTNALLRMIIPIAIS
jgi:hypothetical protein